MPCAIHTWTATAARRDSGRTIAVLGKGECTRAGYTLSLKPGNKGVNPDRTELVLELSITAPPSGADVVTPTTVLFEAKISDEVKFVTIRAPGGNQKIDIRDA